jgi:ABC-type multidrug transport system ATPase subunit
MRARLALAQALLPQPELMILDEPSDGLDPEGIHEMRQTILRLHKEFGLTILLSSHLLNEVEQLCTRIAVLNHGKKSLTGPSPRPPASKTGSACGSGTLIRRLNNSVPPGSSTANVTAN